MPLAEITAAITGAKSSIDLARAMIDLRDSSAFMTKSIELQSALLDTLGKSIAAREEQSLQLDKIRALETEMADLKAWGAEKKDYELTAVGRGAMAYMLKPEARGANPPHWLCPNCFSNGKKAFFQPAMTTGAMGGKYLCPSCNSAILTSTAETPCWNT